MNKYILKPCLAAAAGRKYVGFSGYCHHHNVTMIVAVNSEVKRMRNRKCLVSMYLTNGCVSQKRDTICGPPSVFHSDTQLC